ncbi:MAG: hypothetical protein WEA54_03215, partial [Actinomycetota bacterium]
ATGVTGAGTGDEMWGVKSAGTAAASPAEGPGATITYTHTGQRYVLGYGDDHFGIWDRQTPDTPAERFPRTDDGWRQAWQRYAALEPGNVAVEQTQATPTTGTAQPATTTDPAAIVGNAGGGPAGGETAPIQSAGVSQTSGSAATQYTHSGQRYLLGYGGDFFGIWDRNQLSEPVRRYPRTDAGWRQAWQEFVAWEPNSVEVGIGG